MASKKRVLSSKGLCLAVRWRHCVFEVLKDTKFTLSYSEIKTRSEVPQPQA